MIEQLITSETANLAKEKKFDWNCHWVLYRGTSSVLHKCDAMPMKGKNLESGDYVLQPAQSLLQRWLREVHNIHVTSHCKNTINSKGTYISVVETNNEIEHYHYGWDTFEEALEKGLQEALKLI